jgi:hypothetical protein
VAVVVVVAVVVLVAVVAVIVCNSTTVDPPIDMTSKINITTIFWLLVLRTTS